jgi:prepilin-type N-terminal cleavage/methylation domain-containing protein
MMCRNSGFTLLETMVVMAVMTLVIAVPAFYSYFERQGVRLAVDQLRGDMQLARIMAINRKQTCTIVFNHPEPGRYTNSLSRQVVDLAAYRGGVVFMAKGPEGGKTGNKVSFNRQGMSTSAAAVDVYLADRKATNIYRIRVLGPGGISVTRWSGNHWY